MPISPENRQQQFERLIQKTVRDLPPRRAPGTLENRVLAEIERRATQPWWRKSYAHWPLAARCLFLIGSGGLMKAAIMATIWVLVGFESAPFADAFAIPYLWLHSLAALGSSLWDFAGAVLYSVPRFWFYGGVISLAAMYATVVGLGAFTYRTLHANRNSF
jgi:hypothetical protein